MAKVASTSIYQSIRDHCSIIPYHIHSINEQVIRESELLALNQGIVPDSRQVGGLICKHRILPKKPIKIITCVRNPIDRNRSAFFEAFKYHTGVDSSSWDGDLETLKTLYYEKMNHYYPIEWFDKEMKAMTGIDVYSLPFDKEAGYTRSQIENIDLLILRTDLDDEIKSQIIGQFLDCSSFQLTNSNQGNEKPYADLYRQFKENVYFDKKYLESLLDTRFAKHFFSEEEIMATINKTSS